jgi:hypothetical protein
MVVSLMTNGFLQSTVPHLSAPFTKASLMPAAIRPVSPVVNKYYEAGESTNSVFCSKLMAVLVPNERLWKVFGEPVGTVNGILEHLKICDLLVMHS